MSYAEKDQLAAERGMTLPHDLARDEAMQRHGYNPLPDLIQIGGAAWAKKYLT